MRKTGTPLIDIGQIGDEGDEFVDLFPSAHDGEAVFNFTKRDVQYTFFLPNCEISGMVTTVDFYLGIGSRYSYLAASQIDRIEAQTGCRFVWKPIASGLLIDRRGDNPFRGATGPGVGPGQYDQTYREYDAKGWAAFYGIPFHEPFALEVDPMLPALACLAADRQGALVACCRLFQQLIFAEGRVIDALTIAALPARLGLEEGAFCRDLEGPQIQARHAALIDEAAQRGAFGVPTFFVGQKMFWGNDRLPLLEAVLRGTELPRWRRP